MIPYALLSVHACECVKHRALSEQHITKPALPSPVKAVLEATLAILQHSPHSLLLSALLLWLFCSTHHTPSFSQRCYSGYSAALTTLPPPLSAATLAIHQHLPHSLLLSALLLWLFYSTHHTPSFSQRCYSGYSTAVFAHLLLSVLLWKLL